jgi:hypothetical protein
VQKGCGNLSRTKYVKGYTKDFIIYVIMLGAALTGFVLVFQVIWPYLEIYKQRFLEVSTFLGQNYLFFVLTLVIVLILYFSSKSLILKIRRLFSEMLTAEDVYQTSLQAWKNKEYDVVYGNMKYLVENAKKNNKQNIYLATARAICLFQETSFQDDNTTKEDMKKVVVTLLHTYNYETLYLNTIHLAYSFLHLARLEEQNEDKAIAHIVSAYLFHLSDSKEYKVLSDIETKIFDLLYTEYQSKLEELIPPIVFKTMYQKNVEMDLFQSNILPYLRKVGEYN